VKFSLYIAKRYIFSKKSHNAINVISLISVIGICIATMAMVCVLSIYNGFTDFAVKSFSGLDPDLKVSPVTGKVFDPAGIDFDKISKLSEIETIAPAIEENAFVKFNDRQTTALVKGISPEYFEIVNKDKILFEGDFTVREGDVEFAVVGAGLAADLGVRANYITPMEIFAPKRNVRINLANPNTAFSRKFVYPAGIFLLNQEKYDKQLLFVSIEAARELFRYDREISALEIKLHNPKDVNRIKNQLKTILGKDFYVKDRFEQQEDSFKMVNIEKWMTFIILIFILVIAIFNVIASLSMLILDKGDDIRILQSLGANNNVIVNIFMIEGWLISFVGCITGLVLGLILCLLQQHFGLLKLGADDGTFIINSYPVVVDPSDILITFITVISIGFLVVLYPINTLRKKLGKG